MRSLLDVSEKVLGEVAIKWSQRGTVQAMGYIKVRSPTEGHPQAPNQLQGFSANDSCYRHILKVLYSTVQEQSSD